MTVAIGDGSAEVKGSVAIVAMGTMAANMKSWLEQNLWVFLLATLENVRSQESAVVKKRGSGRIAKTFDPFLVVVAAGAWQTDFHIHTENSGYWELADGVLVTPYQTGARWIHEERPEAAPY